MSSKQDSKGGLISRIRRRLKRSGTQADTPSLEEYRVQDAGGLYDQVKEVRAALLEEYGLTELDVSSHDSVWDVHVRYDFPIGGATLNVTRLVDKRVITPQVSYTTEVIGLVGAEPLADSDTANKPTTPPLKERIDKI